MMKIRFGALAVSISVAVCVTLPAFAAFDENVYMADGAFRYTGNAKKDSGVSITALKQDSKLEDFMSSSANWGMLADYAQIRTDNTGEYAANLNFGGVSGLYELYIGAEESSKVQHKRIQYVNQTLNNSARSALGIALSSGNSGTVAAELSASYKDLGANIVLFEKASAAEIQSAAQVLTNSGINSAALSNAENAALYVDRAVAITLFNANKIKLSEDVSKSLVAQGVSKWYEKSYMKPEHTNYTANMNFIEGKINKGFTSFLDFDRTFLEATILGVIYGADGYGDVLTILSENVAVFGLDSSKITVANAQYLVGKSFSKVDNSIFPVQQTVVPDGIAPGLGGSTGGGGGGGGTLSGNTYPNAAAPTASTLPKPEKTKFSDMAGFEWASAAVNTLYDRNIVSGKQEGIFAPADFVTREEFVKMLLGVVQFENLDGNIAFKDVNKDDWCYSYIKNAYLAGIVKGVSNEEFGVGRRITRQDMAVMCHNALIKKGALDNELQAEQADFVDFDRVAFYAQEAVSSLRSLGLVNGDDNGCFNPEANASRAEAAQMLYNVLMFIER